ncbi:AEC family transporter [Herbidospora daliensis]|uniref:AEC family transporter n=1 Tax=Herbidospora daliensis TaxID=295585 RepID=UPI0007824A51|nr:AEC family transporter [Herbidospora daliensis]
MTEIVTFFAVGVMLGRRQGASEAASQLLDRAVLDWLLPLTIVFQVSRVVWGLHSLWIIGLCFAITALDAVLIFLACRWFRIDGATQRTLLLVAPLGNTAYFGFSAVTAIMGADGLPDAIVFDQLGTTLMFATYANWVANSQVVVDRTTVLQLTRMPALWGLVGGTLLSLTGVDLLNGPVGSLGLAISASLLPLSMIALGTRVTLSGLKRFRELAIGIGVRTVVGPALLLTAVVPLTDLDSSMPAALLQTGMPSMIGAALLAGRHGLDKELAYSMCVVGVPVALVTLPLLHLFIR